MMTIIIISFRESISVIQFSVQENQREKLPLKLSFMSSLFGLLRMPNHCNCNCGLFKDVCVCVCVFSSFFYLIYRIVIRYTSSGHRHEIFSPFQKKSAGSFLSNRCRHFSNVTVCVCVNSLAILVERRDRTLRPKRS